MKTKKYILFALAALLTVSCHDKGKWDEVDPAVGMASVGNQNLIPSNLKTIKEVKDMYASEIANDGLAQVTDYMQIQGIVVGNDEGGNIYQALYVQDPTGAIKISISQSGLYGPFSIGQGVLIELKDLYIGGYGKEPQVGTYYKNPKNGKDGSPQVGRMSRYLWQQHYKLIGTNQGITIEPLANKFSLNDWDMTEQSGKLVTLRGVELKDADGMAVFAPKDANATGGAINRSIKHFSNMVLRTSTYADFANSILPTGRVDITGIVTRFDNTWQLFMRTEDDIKPTILNASDLPPVTAPTGAGTKNDPYNVIGAHEAVKDLDSGSNTTQDIYIKGYVFMIDKSSYSSTYGNINYYISDDPEGKSSSFYVYRGLGLDKSKFTSVDALKNGDLVVTCGTITNYNGVIEYTQGNYLTSLNGKTK